MPFESSDFKGINVNNTLMPFESSDFKGINVNNTPSLHEGRKGFTA